MSEASSAAIAQDCPCIQHNCPIWGNCVECIRGHRRHQRHIPECMQALLRDTIADLARKVEFGVVDERPQPKGS